MPSGLPLVHLHPTLVVEMGGTSKVPVSVTGRLSPAREGKLLWNVCLQPHVQQEGRLQWKEAKALVPLFSVSQMGAPQISRLTLLDCFLKNWDV